jgi:hypothetical protein
MLVLPVGTAHAKLISKCLSEVETAGGAVLVCPEGDGETLGEVGATITIVIRDESGSVIPDFPYPDVWISSDVLRAEWQLCNGAYSCDADASADSEGRMTISGTIAAGGYHAEALYVVAAGIILHDGECDDPMPLIMVSPDLNGDLVVDRDDFIIFGTAYMTGSSDPRFDLNHDGKLSSLDLTAFGDHYLHGCE